MTEVTSPAGAGASSAHLAHAADTGATVLSWLEPAGDAYALRYSEFDGGQWSAAQTLVRAPNLFVNWADLPSVVPIAGRTWAAHWLVLQPAGYEAYDIEMALSSDGGAHWSYPQRLNIDATATEHGFVSLFPWGRDIGVIWLDGRNSAESEAADAGGTSLRYARLAPDGRVLARGAIDELVCDCCKTGVGTTPEGPVVVYRDRNKQEIRDIAVRRFDGRAWSEPVVPGRDEWRIDGCPVNGPAVAARGNALAVAWFTAAAGNPRVRFARSDDGGASFAAPVDLDGEAADGQVGVELMENGDAVVSWWRHAAKGRKTLAARRVEASGRLGPLRVVAEISGAGGLDIPQMTRSGTGLVFAWIDGGDGFLHTAYANNWP